jgi:hypothetical protein
MGHWRSELFGPVEHSSLLGVRKQDAWRAEKSDVIKCLMKGKYWFSDRTRDLLLLTAMDKLDYLLRHSRSSWTPCQGFHLVALLDT